MLAPSGPATLYAVLALLATAGCATATAPPPHVAADKVVVALDPVDTDAANPPAKAPPLVRELPSTGDKAEDVPAAGNSAPTIAKALDELKHGGGLLGPGGFGPGPGGLGGGGLGLRGVGQGGRGLGVVGLGRVGQGGGLGVGGVRQGMGSGQLSLGRLMAGRPKVTGAVTRIEAHRAVRSVLGGLKGCQRMALARKPSLAGTATVAWQLAPNGGVKAMKVQSSSLKDSILERCIHRHLARVRFPSKKGPSTVLVPLVFAPPRSLTIHPTKP